jgi:3-phosphoshikimate 1-carboxyvinyltransferase
MTIEKRTGAAKEIEIEPLSGTLDARITAPPSKAYSLRAIFIASLAEGDSILRNPLLADDQLVAIEALKQFGAAIERKGNDLAIVGTGGCLLAPGKVDAKDSGLTVRLLCSVAAVAGKGGEKIVLDGSGRLRQRPVGDLVEGLSQIGGKIKSMNGNGCPPVEVTGKSLVGGNASINAEKSSQFISSLLIALPLARRDSQISATGPLHSAPYIDITVDCMKSFGISVEKPKNGIWSVKSGQLYRGSDFQIEGDYSSAAFFFEAAAITGGKVRVGNLRRDSVQGDGKILELLSEMGCAIHRQKNTATVEGPEELVPVSADMGGFPDIVMPLAVACAFAKGDSKLSNLGTLRLKESDRVASLQDGLSRMGIQTALEDCGNSLSIFGNPRKVKGATVESFNDHRIAMAFAMAGLAITGMRIKNPDCVKKSFPDFFEKTAAIGKGIDA